MPNFDNIDLAIIAITLLGLMGIAGGFIAKIDLAVIIAFAGSCTTGIAGLAKGKPNGAPPPPPVTYTVTDSTGG